MSCSSGEQPLLLPVLLPPGLLPPLLLLSLLPAGEHQ
jgi:hypothetical protein